MKAASLLLPRKWTRGSPKVLNKISSFMPILAHAGMSGQTVRLRDDVSMDIYAKLVFLSETHE